MDDQPSIFDENFLDKHVLIREQTWTAPTFNLRWCKGSRFE